MDNQWTKNLPKRGCICTHSRTLPQDDHHLLGVHKARSSAQGPRQLSASSTGSRRRWDCFVELMARSNVLQSGFRSPPRRRVPSDRCTITRLCATRERRRGVARFHRTQLTSQRPLHGRTRGCKGVDYTSTYDVAFLVHCTFTFATAVSARPWIGEMVAFRFESVAQAQAPLTPFLVATSDFGDLLVVTCENSFLYAHDHDKLQHVRTPPGMLDSVTLNSVRFNSPADAVLIAGAHFLCVAQTWAMTCIQMQKSDTNLGLATATRT